ncbi:hypothetical protein MMC08_000686 [Hypocenomyce scalaris]|nr:hypothetical protein [Hypocenomyce scalaris]
MARSTFCVSAIWLVTLLISISSASPHYRRQNQTCTPTLGDVMIFADGTYPRANKLSDGSLIGAYTAFDDGNNIITLLKSYDNGTTWTFQGTAAQGPSNATDIDNPYPLQLPCGRIIVAYRNHNKDPTTGVYTFFRITLSYSDDGGVSWEFLSQADQEVGPTTGVWEPFLRLTTATSPTLQIYYSRENSIYDQDGIMRSSPDYGTTWSPPTTVTGLNVSSRDGMIGISSISGKNLRMVFECEQPVNGQPIFTVQSVTSCNDGLTWSQNRQLVYAATGSMNNAGSPQIVTLGSTLAVAFMTDEDTSLHQWINGSDVKMLFSADGGNSWAGKVTVGPVQSNWPGLVGLNQTTALVMFDNGGDKVRSVVVS